MDLPLLLGAVGRSLTLRPLAPASPDGTRFSGANARDTGAIVVVFAILALFETIPIHVLLMHRLGAGHLLAHVGNVGAHLLAVVFVVGDRRALLESAHALLDDHLALHLGARFRGDIPYCVISRVSSSDVVEEDWRTRPRSHVSITPFGSANVVLELAEPVRLRGPFGARAGVSRIHLHVDEPRAFVDALRARLDGHEPKRPRVNR